MSRTTCLPTLTAIALAILLSSCVSPVEQVDSWKREAPAPGTTAEPGGSETSAPAASETPAPQQTPGNQPSASLSGEPVDRPAQVVGDWISGAGGSRQIILVVRDDATYSAAISSAILRGTWNLGDTGHDGVISFLPATLTMGNLKYTWQGINRPPAAADDLPDLARHLLAQYNSVRMRGDEMVITTQDERQTVGYERR